MRFYKARAIRVALPFLADVRFTVRSEVSVLIAAGKKRHGSAAWTVLKNLLTHEIWGLHNSEPCVVAREAPRLAMYPRWVALLVGSGGNGSAVSRSTILLLGRFRQAIQRIAPPSRGFLQSLVPLDLLLPRSGWLSRSSRDPAPPRAVQ